jgi:type VI secretion system secreted protein Hcp
MHFDGIEGTVARKRGGKKGKWIELQSVQLGTSRNVNSPTGQGNNREASAPSVSEIVVTKVQDAASTALFRQTVWGEGKKVVIHFVQDGLNVTEKEPYLILELENTLISSFSVSGAGGENHSAPMESMSLNFVKITYVTTSAVAKPPSRQMWDLNLSPG